MRGNVSLTRIEIAVIIAVILVILAIAVPGLLSSNRASNEREAVTALKTLAAAEADFRTNDRDKNRVNDFWTADVKGLFTMTPAAELEKGDRPKHLPLELISRSVAAADADATFFPAGGENLPLSPFASPAPSIGYWFLALLTDRSESGPEIAYRQDTGGNPPMGSVHHLSRFGFAAFPDSSSRGRRLYIINENGTVFRHGLRTNGRLGSAVPPGRKGLSDFYQHWPDDTHLKRISLLCCGDCHCPECGYAGEHDP
jgi:type II secretory pathway pseudopilin PulG